MPSEAAASIASMLVKLPEFWLKICFGQVEASFGQAGITASATKYNCPYETVSQGQHASLEIFPAFTRLTHPQ
jgi:hypothetical protein